MRAGRSYIPLLIIIFSISWSYSKFWQITYSVKKSSEKPSSSGQLCWTALILCSYAIPHLCHFISPKSNRCKCPPFERNGNLTPDLRAALCYPKILIHFPCNDLAACLFPDSWHLAAPIWKQIPHWCFVNCHQQLLILQDISHVPISTSVISHFIPCSNTRRVSSGLSDLTSHPFVALSKIGTCRSEIQSIESKQCGVMFFSWRKNLKFACNRYFHMRLTWF